MHIKFLNEVKNIEKDDALDRAYISFVGTFMEDSKAKRAFFKNLSDQGYNAIIDDFDVKFGSDNKRQNFVESMILFNNNDVSFHKALPISDKDAKYLSDIFNLSVIISLVTAFLSNFTDVLGFSISLDIFVKILFNSV